MNKEGNHNHITKEMESQKCQPQESIFLNMKHRVDNNEQTHKHTHAPHMRLQTHNWVYSKYKWIKESTN